MKNKNKVIILASIIVGVLVLTLGITYAVITFNETKGNSQLVLGDIYMHYGETNQINLQNAIPTESYIPNGYFEFTIDGKNTYTKKDIWYEIVLNHGDNHETRQTRIRDDLLKFRLVEINNNVETELFTNKSYSSLTNKRIWVDTISKNTTSEITKTYRLYMWISNDTKVGNTSDADYDNETWNDDVYGSIKVSVTGDFQEKELAYEDKYNVTDESCFETEEITLYEANPNLREQEIIDNELTRCIEIYTNRLEYEFDEGSNAESYCKGTGTARGGYTIQEDLNNWIAWAETQEGGIEEKFINGGGQVLLDANVIIYENDSYTVNSIMENQETTELSICVNSLLLEFGPEEELEDYEEFCRGTIMLWGYTFNQVLNNENFWSSSSELYKLENNNVIFSKEGLLITDYNSTCGSDVVIPKTINGTPLTTLSLGNDAFRDKNLTSVVIPNTVVSINEFSFNKNKLKSITLESGSQLKEIQKHSFSNNLISEVDIPNSIEYLSCIAFDENVVINTRDDLVCIYDELE